MEAKTSFAMALMEGRSIPVPFSIIDIEGMVVAFYFCKIRGKKLVYNWDPFIKQRGTYSELVFGKDDLPDVSVIGYGLTMGLENIRFSISESAKGEFKKCVEFYGIAFFPEVEKMCKILEIVPNMDYHENLILSRIRYFLSPDY